MTFNEWILERYNEWRGTKIGRSASVKNFAEMIGVPRTLVVRWLNGETVALSQKYLNLLCKQFGPGVFCSVGLNVPNELSLFDGVPEDLAAAVKDLLSDVRVLGLDRNSLASDCQSVRPLVAKYFSGFMS